MLQYCEAPLHVVVPHGTFIPESAPASFAAAAPASSPAAAPASSPAAGAGVSVSLPGGCCSGAAAVASSAGAPASVTASHARCTGPVAWHVHCPCTHAATGVAPHSAGAQSWMPAQSPAEGLTGSPPFTLGFVASSRVPHANARSEANPSPSPIRVRMARAGAICVPPADPNKNTPIASLESSHICASLGRAVRWLTRTAARTHGLQAPAGHEIDHPRGPRVR